MAANPRGISSSLRLQPICNCLGLIFLKITCICLARERTAVSVRFIRMPIALELSPVSANLRSLRSSACVHGREAKCSGSVIDPRARVLRQTMGFCLFHWATIFVRQIDGDDRECGGNGRGNDEFKRNYFCWSSRNPRFDLPQAQDATFG
jgi:hypothetical protein